MKRKRKARVVAKPENWRCIVCKDYARLIEVQAYPNGNLGMALCFPCARRVASLLPGEVKP